MSGEVCYIYNTYTGGPKYGVSYKLDSLVYDTVYYAVKDMVVGDSNLPAIVVGFPFTDTTITIMDTNQPPIVTVTLFGDTIRDTGMGFPPFNTIDSFYNSKQSVCMKIDTIKIDTVYYNYPWSNQLSYTIDTTYYLTFKQVKLLKK